MRNIIIWQILLLSLLPTCARTQDSTNLHKQETVSIRPVSDEQWKQSSKGLDYSKDVEKEEDPYNDQPAGSAVNWTALSQGWGMFFQVVAILLAVLAISYLIYRMLQEPSNRTIARDGVEITTENLDAYIHETDLDRFLREALTAGNHPLAIRLYYLKTIKSLDEQQAIRWAREKTNREYLREMQNHPKGQLFRTVTYLYESIWYGNQTLTKENFDQIEPVFIQMADGRRRTADG
jgi:hypothetical protein